MVERSYNRMIHFVVTASNRVDLCVRAPKIKSVVSYEIASLRSLPSLNARNDVSFILC